MGLGDGERICTLYICCVDHDLFFHTPAVMIMSLLKSIDFELTTRLLNGYKEGEPSTLLSKFLKTSRGLLFHPKKYV